MDDPFNFHEFGWTESSGSDTNAMVLKTGMVKEPEKGVVFGFVVRPGSNRWCHKHLINNFKIIKIYNKFMTNNISCHNI